MTQSVWKMVCCSRQDTAEEAKQKQALLKENQQITRQSLTLFIDKDLASATESDEDLFKPKKRQNRRMKNSFGATDILNEHEIGEVKNLEDRNELLQNDIEYLLQQIPELPKTAKNYREAIFQMNH